MRLGSWLKSGGIAAALAVLALPALAQAQERGQGGWSPGGGRPPATVDNRSGNWRGGSWRGDSWRGDQPGPTPPPQTAVPPRHEGHGRGNGQGRGGEARWHGDTNQWTGSDKSSIDRNNTWQKGNDYRWREGQGYRGNGDKDNTWRGGNDYRWQSDNAWRGDRSNYAGNWAGSGAGNWSGKWNRDWRSDGRYDWRGYRNANREVYRLSTYYAPYRGYSYRRLSAGHQIDNGFYGSRYLIADPWQYRLPPVYGSYRWVRYFGDALLIDIVSGQVMDAIYSFFW